MHVQHIPLEQTGHFSSLFLNYIHQQEDLKPFYTLYPTLENFKESTESRQLGQAKRETLHRVLHSQYATYPPLVHTQIDTLLRPTTFTVTTGHQLNILGGPLYLIYKLITVINLAKQLQEAYPAYHFVPVYWMATEDHDFAEINHFHLFGQQHTWETAQTGAVGRMNPQELQTVFGQMAEKLPLFEKAYLTTHTLADATRCWVHELFGDQGLLCLDADDQALKAQFTEVIKEDVLAQTTYTAVTQTTEQLEALGYKTQVNPREINFFYLDGHLRERITRQGDRFTVLNTDLSFSESEMRELIEKHPEKFSPNVLLRPVYQETILPNLAYIGGPAEVAYWLQLKGIFDRTGTPFPALMPRNFALFINQTIARKLRKLCLPVEDYFLDETQLKRQYMACAVPNAVEMNAEKEALIQAFATLHQKAVQLDKTLDKFIGAQRQRTLHILEHVEKRLKKAEEQNQAVGINQLLSVKSKLFPNDNLQERVDNFLNFYLNDARFLDTLLTTFDPFDFRFYVLTDDE